MKLKDKEILDNYFMVELERMQKEMKAKMLALIKKRKEQEDD